MAEQAWIHDARSALRDAEVDYFEVRAGRYWRDFIISLVCAYGSASVFLMAPLGSVWQWIAYPAAIFWLYRLGSLVHEVCHLRQHEMRAFKITWNLLVGVITLSPSPFFTRHHRDHHSRKFYGTHEDPEYVLNFRRFHGGWGMWEYALEIALFPLVVFLRFLVAPLTFLHPTVRRLALRRGCALTPNWNYERNPNVQERHILAAIELLCSLRAVLMIAAVFLGWTDWTRLPLMYALAVGVLTLNQLRLLGDHQLQSEGAVLPLEDHVRDSCNYTGHDAVTSLLYPFAIRYHALHHLFPSLPYHNLSAAHLYLEDHLPSDSPYHALSQPSWWSVAKHAFRAKVQTTPAQHSPDEIMHRLADGG